MQKKTYPWPFVAALLFGFGAAGLVVTAWGFEIIGGYVPCKLCLMQRTPYYVAIPLALLAAICAQMSFAKSTCVARGLLVLTAFTIWVSAGIAIYQAGAQWSFWQGPNDCGGGSALEQSVDNLLSTLETIKIVSCTEVDWRLLGLSFAGWNAVGTLFLGALALYGALGRRSKSDCA